MNPFEQIAIAWQALARSVSNLRRPALWVPALLLGAALWSVIGLMCEFARPVVSWVMVPLLHRAGGDAMLRYPNLFVSMPTLFARADVVIGATLGAWVFGALTLLFAATFRGEQPRPFAALERALRRAPALVIANLPVHALLFALAFGVDAWLMSRGSGGLVRKLSGLIVAGAAVLMQSLWFYVTCEIMLAGRGWFGAWNAIPRAAARGFWAALLVTVLSALVLMPFDLLSQRSSMIVNRGVPELVAMLMVVRIAVEIVRGLLIAGSATLIFLAEVGERDEDHR